MSYDFSSNRHDMVLGEEVGGFLERLMDSERVAGYNDNLQHRNMAVIRWLRAHDAPEELIQQALYDSAAGNNAILTVIDEIRLMGTELVVIPKDILELFLEAAGPQATRLFVHLCQEQRERSMQPGGKDYREKQGRP